MTTAFPRALVGGEPTHAATGNNGQHAFKILKSDELQPCGFRVM